MPRYFFDVEDGLDLRDTEGTLCADDEAARLVAVTTSGEMLRAHARAFWTTGTWRMHVTDEAGATVCDLRFASVPPGS